MSDWVKRLKSEVVRFSEKHCLQSERGEVINFYAHSRARSDGDCSQSKRQG